MNSAVVAKNVFCEVTATFDLWPRKFNQFIFESKWSYMPSLEEFPQGGLEISHSQQWYGRTTQKHKVSCRQKNNDTWDPSLRWWYKTMSSKSLCKWSKLSYRFALFQEGHFLESYLVLFGVIWSAAMAALSLALTLIAFSNSLMIQLHRPDVINDTWVPTGG